MDTKIVPLDCKIFQSIYIHQRSVENQVQHILNRYQINKKTNYIAWLIKAVTVIDLTTLAGDDTQSNVQRLCCKAAKPIPEKYLQMFGFDKNTISNIKTAAVCVYPSRVEDAAKSLKELNMDSSVNIAAVATGFPSGLYSLETRLQEIEYALKMGANEIDVVIDRSLVLTGKWDILYEELLEMRKACGNAHMKVILGVGELHTYTNVYKASMVAMKAGADFIKTSTGKETVNATLEVGLVMCRAIKHYQGLTGRKVGLKPAGGIKTPQDAVKWLILVKVLLGDEWLSPTLFRIGASSLLGGIEKEIYEFATGRIADTPKFSFI